MSTPSRAQPGQALILVADVAARHRYEARIDGQLVAIAEYLPLRKFLVLTHTEVLPGFEGRGIAGTLVTKALNDVRRRGLHVIPRCPDVAAFIQRHPLEYADLVVTSSTRDSPTPRG